MRAPSVRRCVSLHRVARCSWTLCLAAILSTLTIELRAHDIYTSWAEGHVRQDRFELTLTLARAAALRLIPDSSALPPITPENFPDYSARLKALASTLLEISNNGKPMKLSSSEVKISGDADITFHLVYARPAAGPLRFVARYLSQLVDGHVGTLVLNDAAGKNLGWSPVTVDEPVFEIRIPNGSRTDSPQTK
jgi:hypothetical protein